MDSLVAKLSKTLRSADQLVRNELVRVLTEGAVTQELLRKSPESVKNAVAKPSSIFHKQGQQEDQMETQLLQHWQQLSPSDAKQIEVARGRQQKATALVASLRSKVISSIHEASLKAQTAEALQQQLHKLSTFQEATTDELKALLLQQTESGTALAQRIRLDEEQVKASQAKFKQVQRGMGSLEQKAKRMETKRKNADLEVLKLKGELHKIRSAAALAKHKATSALAPLIAKEEEANNYGNRQAQVQAQKSSDVSKVKAGKIYAKHARLVTEAEARLNEAEGTARSAKQAEGEADALAFGASVQLSTLVSQIDSLRMDGTEANLQLKQLRKDTKLLRSQECRGAKHSKVLLRACEKSASTMLEAQKDERSRALNDRKHALVAAKASQDKLKQALLKLFCLIGILAS
jgi:RPA family protein